MWPARWIDAHCHLADTRIEPELPRILKDAEEAGIRHFVQGGVDPEDWTRQEGLKARFPGKIVTAFGIHPWWAAAHTASEFDDAFSELERRIPEADARGEMGLDFSPRFEASTHETQIRAFEGQLELDAEEPVVLHVVRAHEPAVSILKKRNKTFSGIVHSFSANREIARNYLDLGLSLSISGVITRKGFETLRRTVRYIPGDRLLIETDSPDQKPAGWLRPWNEPVTLLQTARVLAELRGEDERDVLDRSARNLEKMFGRNWPKME